MVNGKLSVINQSTFTCSKLIEKREQCGFIVNFEHILHLALMFLSLTLNK